VFGDCDIMADMKVRVVAKSTLERFKHQNIILKKFGKDGIVLYKLIKGDILVSTLKKRVQIPPEVVDEIISFMLKYSYYFLLNSCIKLYSKNLASQKVSSLKL